MDILKILLVYLSATMALSVQAAPAPVVTPAPTAVVTPAPAETEVPEAGTETPAPPEEESATPAPTVSVTPAPVPTITPNKAYRNLAQGSRGAEVRKLQERLIELGYLPEGSADGAYGAKTRNAVRKFQYYNGLTQDGVAGRATQTNLFENPDVAPYPAKESGSDPTKAPAATPTVKPTETPTATPTVKPTEAPTATPTAKPTEAPTATPTVKPTEAPTAAPTAKPTEAPTATPTAKPTEIPTEKPAEVPAKTSAVKTGKTPAATPVTKPTETPTAKPTETPAATPVTKPTETPMAKPTETPAAAPTEAASATPSATPQTEAVYVDLDLEGYEEITGSVAVNEADGPLSWTALEDGVTVRKTPRLRLRDDEVWISLEDLADALEDWVLTRDENGTLVLEAEGHTIALVSEESGPVATVNGSEMAMTGNDFDFVEEGCFIRSGFLASLFGGEAVWVPDENTLMLRLPAKAVTEATD